jgi:hypothetical protein
MSAQASSVRVTEQKWQCLSRDVPEQHVCLSAKSNHDGVGVGVGVHVNGGSRVQEAAHDQRNCDVHTHNSNRTPAS